MPLISVIMPVYNGELYLGEAIDSILAQTFTDFELLIVDDGSEDNSAAIIRSYEERDSRIRFFQLPRNMGLADARNRGIVAAKGGYITFMDCDDVSLPERLDKQATFLRSNPEIGAVGTCARLVNHDLSSLLYYYTFPQQHALIAMNWFFRLSFLGATLMLRREFLLTVEGYEPGRRAVDDLELFARLLHKTPIKFSNLPENLYLYRQYGQSKRKVPGTKIHAAYLDLRKRVLESLWNEAPEATLERFYRLRRPEKLSWAQRRAAKRDIKRLIESMIEQQWVESDDKPLLLAEMNRRLEQASPRIWQQFCHWRRHRFPRLFPDTLQLYQEDGQTE